MQCKSVTESYMLQCQTQVFCVGYWSFLFNMSCLKYETNKIQPPPLLEKTAAAPSVSYNALNGSDTAGLRLETIGNLMGACSLLFLNPALLFGYIKTHNPSGGFRYYPIILPFPNSPPFVLHSYPKRI